MKWVDFDVIDDEGNIVTFPVNADQVCFIVPLLIRSPQNITGPDGKPVAKKGAGLDFGVKVLPVCCTVEEAKRKLSGEAESNLMV